MATIKDVAKAAGCSISTVSYALNNDKRIPEVTASRIKKIADEINYLPSAAARNLKKQNTNTILVAISDFGGPVYHELLDGIHNELAKYEYTMVVATGASTDNLLKQRTADGAIISDIHVTDTFLKQISKNFNPIIVLDRSLKAENIYNMTIDNHQAMVALTEDIILKGYKHIAYVHGVLDTYDNQTRFSGLKEALKAHKLEIFKEYYGNFTTDSGNKIAEQILKEEQKPDMVVCGNDEMALGIMEVLQEHQIEIPMDIGISGFDDIQLSSYFNPKLSSIKINHYQWGQKIAKTLLKLLKGEDVHTKKELGTIIIRDSY